MKKLLVFFLMPFCQLAAMDVVRRQPPAYSNALSDLLKKNLAEQQDVYKKIIGLEGVINGIWVPLIITTGFKQELNACDIGKAFAMTFVVKKVLGELQDHHQKLLERACELKYYLDKEYRPAEYPPSMPRKSELFQNFCAGFLTPPIIHICSKITL